MMKTSIDIKDFVDSKSTQTAYKRYTTADIMISDFNRWLETVGNPDYTTNSITYKTIILV